MARKYALGLFLQIARQALDEVRTPERIDRARRCLSRARESAACGAPASPPPRSAARALRRASSCAASWSPPSTADERLQRGAHDVVHRLLRRQRHAGGLRMKAQLQRALVPGAEPLAHHARPDAPRGAILGDLFEEVAVRVEEERHARHELVHVESRVDARLHVLDAVAQRERQFLRRRRSRLSDVVAAHRDRVPPRHVRRAERKDVGDEPHRRARRVDVLLLRDEFLEDVVLNRPRNRLPVDRPPLGEDEIHREDHRRRRVDRHRRRDVAERDAVEQRFHVGERCHVHAALPHFAERQRMIGDRVPSASADRTRHSIPSLPRRAARDTAGSCPPASRTPQTASSSTACRGSRTDECRACMDTRPDRQARARSRTAECSRACRDARSAGRKLSGRCRGCGARLTSSPTGWDGAFMFSQRQQPAARTCDGLLKTCYLRITVDLAMRLSTSRPRPNQFAPFRPSRP